ncbi:IS630 family transposase [Nodosilinea nodulosa]|uniref:IS630 family transposase n=1 Tax=Nodosilinea nodulosa TaxID=416001 RepID=UPI000370D7D5|nr:IS630 family transposase [Nodosilinea nodulosa]
MPIKNYLTAEEKQELQKQLKFHEHPDVRERILILLLRNDGRKQQEIADFLGCSLRKVAYWCAHGNPSDLASLTDERMHGNYHKATDQYVNLLLDVIEKEPQELGYEFGRWTAARLATYLEQETGIQLSGSQVRRILKSKKYVYLWAKYSLEEKQDPEKRKLFKAKLEEYLRITKESPENLQVWFWDECGFSLRVTRRKDWVKKGTRKKVSGIRRKGRINVMGGIRYSDKKRLVDFLPKGTGENFYKVLKNFYEEVIYDWAGEDRSVSEFEKDGPKVVIILDNASIHKKEEFTEKIKLEMPNLVLEFLPEYSPDYNLVELVWHSAKEFISNRLFKSIEDLEALINKLLNEGELAINWHRKVKNKGSAIDAI